MHVSNAPSIAASNAARYARTDVTDGRTDEESFSPTRDNPSSSVTRTRTYRFCPDDFGDTARTAAAMVYLAPPDPDAPLHLMQLHWALGDFCTIPGCPNPRRALCLCDTHYRAHVRATRNEAHLINRKAS